MKDFILKNNLTWAVLSGILIGTSYPPFPAWAIFFCLLPLWTCWEKATNLKAVLTTGFITQFTLTLVGFNWVAHTATEYGHLPSVVSFLILIGFCSFASLHLVFAGALAFEIKRRFGIKKPWAFFMILAVLSATFEWIYPMIFPWNFGYPLLYSKFHTSQLAEFFGFNILSLSVFLSNSAFAISMNHYPRRRWSLPVIIFVLLLFLGEVGGTFAEKSVPLEDQKLTTLLIQPNVGNFDKYFAQLGRGYQEPVVRKIFAQTDSAFRVVLPKPDLIIWPETAFPDNLDKAFLTRPYPIKLTDFIKGLQTPVLTGAYSEDPPYSFPHAQYNGIFIIDKSGEVTQSYRKHTLLAFGEYFPGASLFPFLPKLIPEISNFGRGPGAAVLNLGPLVLSPLICYEALYTQYVGESVKLGGQILVNLTNDSWFGKNFEPYQHMIMTLARAIEYRRPMIRLTNTGISSAVDARGRVLSRSPQDVEWAESVTIPYSSAPKNTLFSCLVPFLTWIFLGLSFLAILVGIKFGRE